MTKQQLQYFLSAVEFSNFSKAASFHYASIPTFIRHINDLEEELDTKLFHRSNRGLTLTAAGALFHSFARDTLLGMYQYYVTIRDKGYLVGEEHDEFIMGYYAFGGMFPAFSKLVDRYLNLWLKKPCVLHCVRGGEMTDLVRNGLIDVGAVSSSQLEKYGDEFESRTFYKWECQLLVEHDHPLADQDSISVDDIIANYSSFRHYLPEGLVDENIRNQSITSSADIMTLCRMFLEFLPIWSSSKTENDELQIGSHMLLTPSTMQRPELAQKHILRITGANPTMDVKLFWKKNNANPSIQKFKEALDFAENS